MCPFLGNVCLYLLPFFLSHHLFFLLVLLFLLARTVEKAIDFCLLPLRPGLRREEGIFFGDPSGSTGVHSGCSQSVVRAHQAWSTLSWALPLGVCDDNPQTWASVSSFIRKPICCTKGDMATVWGLQRGADLPRCVGPGGPAPRRSPPAQSCALCPRAAQAAPSQRTCAPASQPEWASGWLAGPVVSVSSSVCKCLCTASSPTVMNLQTFRDGPLRSRVGVPFASSPGLSPNITRCPRGRPLQCLVRCRAHQAPSCPFPELRGG